MALRLSAGERFRVFSTGPVLLSEVACSTVWTCHDTTSPLKSFKWSRQYPVLPPLSNSKGTCLPDAWSINFLKLYTGGLTLGLNIDSCLFLSILPHLDVFFPSVLWTLSCSHSYTHSETYHIFSMSLCPSMRSVFSLIYPPKHPTSWTAD